MKPKYKISYASEEHIYNCVFSMSFKNMKKDDDWCDGVKHFIQEMDKKGWKYVPSFHGDAIQEPHDYFDTYASALMYFKQKGKK